MWRVPIIIVINRHQSTIRRMGKIVISDVARAPRVRTQYAVIDRRVPREKLTFKPDRKLTINVRQERNINDE